MKKVWAEDSGMNLQINHDLDSILDRILTTGGKRQVTLLLPLHLEMNEVGGEDLLEMTTGLEVEDGEMETEIMTRTTIEMEETLEEADTGTWTSIETKTEVMFLNGLLTMWAPPSEPLMPLEHLDLVLLNRK